MLQRPETQVESDPIKTTVERTQLIEKYKTDISEAIRWSDCPHKDEAKSALHMLCYLAALGVLTLQFHGCVDDILPPELKQS